LSKKERPRRKETRTLSRFAIQRSGNSGAGELHGLWVKLAAGPIVVHGDGASGGRHEADLECAGSACSKRRRAAIVKYKVAGDVNGGNLERGFRSVL